jgi:hypothetical protein
VLSAHQFIEFTGPVSNRLTQPGPVEFVTTLPGVVMMLEVPVAVRSPPASSVQRPPSRLATVVAVVPLVVASPVRFPVWAAWDPAPTRIWPLARDEELVVHVVQVSVTELPRAVAAPPPPRGELVLTVTELFARALLGTGS